MSVRQCSIERYIRFLNIGLICFLLSGTNGKDDSEYWACRILLGYGLLLSLIIPNGDPNVTVFIVTVRHGLGLAIDCQTEDVNRYLQSKYYPIPNIHP